MAVTIDTMYLIAMMSQMDLRKYSNSIPLTLETYSYNTIPTTEAEIAFSKNSCN